MTKIAKYRKEGCPGEWWLTDFTMEQVEGRIEHLEKEITDLKKFISILKEVTRQYDSCSVLKKTQGDKTFYVSESFEEWAERFSKTFSKFQD